MGENKEKPKPSRQIRDHEHIVNPEKLVIPIPEPPKPKDKEKKN